MHVLIFSNNQKDFLQTENKIASTEAFCPPFSWEIKRERHPFLTACVISFLPNQRLHSVSNPAWLGVEVLAFRAARGAGLRCLMASTPLQSTSMLCRSVCICICKPENGYSRYKIGSFTARGWLIGIFCIKLLGSGVVHKWGRRSQKQKKKTSRQRLKWRWRKDPSVQPLPFPFIYVAMTEDRPEPAAKANQPPLTFLL